MIERIVERNEAGQRSDKFLRKLFPLAPSSLIYKWLRKKSITCNGKKMDGSEKLEPGDRLSFFLSEETYFKFQTPTEEQEDSIPSPSYEKWARRMPVIYQDPNVLILNKPAGILSQKGDKDDYCVADFVRDHCLQEGIYSPKELQTFHPAVANRLDRNTSGLILCGLSLQGLQKLTALIADRTLIKQYRAIVKGSLPRKEGVLTGVHQKDSSKNQVVIRDTELYPDLSRAREALAGAERSRKMALTGFRVLEEVRNSSGIYSMIEVTLYTGYSHQIRAHFASIGCPLMGDPKYGNRTGAEPKAKRKPSGREAARQMLHAERLIIPPEADLLPELCGKTFTAELPPDMKKLWKDLKGES